MEETLERRGPGRPRMQGAIVHHVSIPGDHAAALQRLARDLDRPQASLIREGVALLLEKWSDKNR